MLSGEQCLARVTDRDAHGPGAVRDRNGRVSGNVRSARSGLGLARADDGVVHSGRASHSWVFSHDLDHAKFS